MMGSTEAPQIHPVPAGGARPTWSVMIPTYEGSEWLRVTLESVLAQDPGPEAMQIEVVDDHSTSDDPASVVQELGGGRVTFYRQPRNVGHTANFNTCLQRSRGELVHLLHGDDAVRPGFYHRVGEVFQDHAEVAAVVCRFIGMDGAGRWRSIKQLIQEEPGLLPDPLGAMAAHGPFQSPAAVVRREVFERVGGYLPSIRYCGEDWEMGMRIAASHPVWYEVEPLALRRDHEGSLTGRATHLALNTRELREVIRLSEAHFPEERRSELRGAASKYAALWALELADSLHASGDRAGARRQLRTALLTSRSWRVLGRAYVTLLWWGGSALRSLVARS